MKFAARILSAVILVSLTAFYMGCDDTDNKKKPETDVQIELLNGSWEVTTYTLDGAKPALNFDNLVITIDGQAGNQSVTYSVAGRPVGPNPWNSSGTLTFAYPEQVKQMLQREDDIDVAYSVTATSLVVDFTFNIAPYNAGRTSNVSGNWHFEFTKQQ